MGKHYDYRAIIEALERLESRVEQVVSLVEAVLDEVVPAAVVANAYEEE